MRIIAAALPGKRVARLPDVRVTPLKVLFLRFERIGDMIMATSIIRAIATSSPLVTLDVVSAPSTRAVLDHNPHVRKVFTLDRRAWRSYRRLTRELATEHYDVIVDGRLNNPPVFTSTPLLMWGAKAPYRVGAGGGNNDLVYNVRVKAYDRSTHYIRGSRALAAPFGVDASTIDWRPEIFLTDDERERADAVWQRAVQRVSPASGEKTRFLVNLSASERKRRWADANFVTVLKAVRADHPTIPIVVMGLPSERESVEAVARTVDAEPASTPELRDALALVAASDRILTPDTSISHAASAFGKAVVVLLRRDCDPYAPWDVPGELVFWDGETVHALQPEVVLSAVSRLLSPGGEKRDMRHDAEALRVPTTE